MGALENARNKRKKNYLVFYTVEELIYGIFYSIQYENDRSKQDLFSKTITFIWNLITHLWQAIQLLFLCNHIYSQSNGSTSLVPIGYFFFPLTYTAHISEIALTTSIILFILSLICLMTVTRIGYCVENKNANYSISKRYLQVFIEVIVRVLYLDVICFFITNIYQVPVYSYDFASVATHIRVIILLLLSLSLLVIFPLSLLSALFLNKYEKLRIQYSFQYTGVIEVFYYLLITLLCPAFFLFLTCSPFPDTLTASFNGVSLAIVIVSLVLCLIVSSMHVMKHPFSMMFENRLRSMTYGICISGMICSICQLCSDEPFPLESYILIIFIFLLLFFYLSDIRVKRIFRVIDTHKNQNYDRMEKEISLHQLYNYFISKQFDNSANGYSHLSSVRPSQFQTCNFKGVSLSSASRVDREKNISLAVLDDSIDSFIERESKSGGIERLLSMIFFCTDIDVIFSYLTKDWSDLHPYEKSNIYYTFLLLSLILQKRTSHGNSVLLLNAIASIRLLENLSNANQLLIVSTSNTGSVSSGNANMNSSSSSGDASNSAAANTLSSTNISYIMNYILYKIQIEIYNSNTCNIIMKSSKKNTTSVSDVTLYRKTIEVVSNGHCQCISKLLGVMKKVISEKDKADFRLRSREVRDKEREVTRELQTAFSLLHKTNTKYEFLIRKFPSNPDAIRLYKVFRQQFLNEDFLLAFQKTPSQSGGPPSKGDMEVFSEAEVLSEEGLLSARDRSPSDGLLSEEDFPLSKVASPRDKKDRPSTAGKKGNSRFDEKESGVGNNSLSENTSVTASIISKDMDTEKKMKIKEIMKKLKKSFSIVLLFTCVSQLILCILIIISTYVIANQFLFISSTTVEMEALDVQLTTYPRTCDLFYQLRLVMEEESRQLIQVPKYLKTLFSPYKLNYSLMDETYAYNICRDSYSSIQTSMAAFPFSVVRDRQVYGCHVICKDLELPPYYFSVDPVTKVLATSTSSPERDTFEWYDDYQTKISTLGLKGADPYTSIISGDSVSSYGERIVTSVLLPEYTGGTLHCSVSYEYQISDIERKKKKIQDQLHTYNINYSSEIDDILRISMKQNNTKMTALYYDNTLPYRFVSPLGVDKISMMGVQHLIYASLIAFQYGLESSYNYDLFSKDLFYLQGNDMCKSIVIDSLDYLVSLSITFIKDSIASSSSTIVIVLLVIVILIVVTCVLTLYIVTTSLWRFNSHGSILMDIVRGLSHDSKIEILRYLTTLRVPNIILDDFTDDSVTTDDPFVWEKKPDVSLNPSSRRILSHRTDITTRKEDIVVAMDGTRGLSQRAQKDAGMRGIVRENSAMDFGTARVGKKENVGFVSNEGEMKKSAVVRPTELQEERGATGEREGLMNVSKRDQSERETIPDESVSLPSVAKTKTPANSPLSPPFTFQDPADRGATVEALMLEIDRKNPYEDYPPPSNRSTTPLPSPPPLILPTPPPKPFHQRAASQESMREQSVIHILESSIAPPLSFLQKTLQEAKKLLQGKISLCILLMCLVSLATYLSTTIISIQGIKSLITYQDDIQSTANLQAKVTASMTRLYDISVTDFSPQYSLYYNNTPKALTEFKTFINSTYTSFLSLFNKVDENNHSIMRRDPARSVLVFDNICVNITDHSYDSICQNDGEVFGLYTFFLNWIEKSKWYLEDKVINGIHKTMADISLTQSNPSDLFYLTGSFSILVDSLRDLRMSFTKEIEERAEDYKRGQYYNTIIIIGLTVLCYGVFVWIVCLRRRQIGYINAALLFLPYGLMCRERVMERCFDLSLQEEEEVVGEEREAKAEEAGEEVELQPDAQRVLSMLTKEQIEQLRMRLPGQAR